MTPTKESSTHDSWVARCAWGALPLLVCLLFLRLARESSPSGFIAACVACAIVLWFGWRSVRRNAVTKWTGVFLGLYCGMILGLTMLAIVIRLSLVLLPVFLIVLPILVY